MLALAAPSNASEAVSLAVGLLQIVLAAVATRGLLEHGRRFPWLMLLGVFFAARGVDRIVVAFSASDNANVSLATDGLAVGVLLLLILRLDDTVGGLRRAEDVAQWNQDEYERALVDYRTLVRHRLASPLTILRGAVETLARRDQELAPHDRERLFGLLRSELDRLGSTTLDPRPERPEERVLAPEPRPEPLPEGFNQPAEG
jgi:signal transduction histidine kinase